MDLKTSAMLEAVNPAQATALKTQFASQLAANEAALHATIKASARAELAALEATLPQMRASYVDQLKRYFESCSSSLDSAAANANPGRPGVLAAGGLDINLIKQNFQQDLSLSVSFLNDALNNACYKHVLESQAREMKKAEVAAARAAAEAMEVDTPNDILVGQLVKREISKNVSALRKEVNLLRSALKDKVDRRSLNDPPNRPGKPIGKNGKTPTPRIEGGGKARGPPQGGSNGKPKKRNETPKGAAGGAPKKKQPAQPSQKKHAKKDN
ncbi:unnamed protein product [Aphanomyces euteiches]